jgi:GMP synthase-like glutamine amidotransferase
VKDFNAWYGAYQALYNITLNIPSQRVTSLIGPSGCGKSTFLRWINRMNDLVPNARADGVMQLDKDDLLDRNFDVVELRRRVTLLLEQNKKLLGICFGHQLIALCLGAKVGRAPQGWGVGRMSYDWHAADLPLATEDKRLALLVSHQDQVLELPQNAVLLASNAHCPVAGYAIGEEVFCVQGHPEFVEDYSAFLLNRRRERLGENLYSAGVDSLQHGHDGVQVARMMVAFVEGKAGAWHN